MPNYTFELTDEEGDEIQHVLPGKYEICPRCEGAGKHDHPAFANGFTGEELRDDPDFAEEYRIGRYDVPCEKCHGKRVIVVPAENLTADQKKALKEYHEVLREMAADDRSERHLRMMESGGY